MFQYIYIRIFLASFIIGFIFVRALGPKSQTINVLPTPDTTDTVIFKNNDGTCYKFKPTHVNCAQHITNTG